MLVSKLVLDPAWDYNSSVLNQDQSSRESVQNYIFVQVPGRDVQVYGFQPDRMIMGRGTDCTLHIPLADVSRQHAEIFFQDGQPFLKDLQSRNGTFLNGRLLLTHESYPLKNGDMIQAGAACLWISDSPVLSSAMEARKEMTFLDTMVNPLESFIQQNPSDSKWLHLVKSLQKFDAVEEIHHIDEVTKAVLLELFQPQQCNLVLSGDLKKISQIKEKDFQKLETTGFPFFTFLPKEGWHRRLLSDLPLTSVEALLWPVFDSAAQPSRWIFLSWGQAVGLAAQEVLSLIFVSYQASSAQKKLKESRLQKLTSATHASWQWVGQSAQMQVLSEQIQHVAPADATVLLLGETGTGKEMAARMIHSWSARSDKSLVCVNCGAITETLLESELFGHEKGAFTGAHQTRIGKFEQASGGTLFLDEIAEMSPELQKKLLRVLESKEFTRVGGNEVLKSRVRVIAATHRDLPSEIAKGRFREDLYYRLNVVALKIPALRERKEDIPLLADFFAERIAQDLGRQAPELTEEVLDRLLSYDWPGNIRELKNALERVMVLSSTHELKKEDFNFLGGPEAADAARFFEATLEESRLRCEREYLVRLMQKTKGNVTEGAAIAGMARQNLHEALKRHGIEAEPFRNKSS
jgi:DNA-binding NtrC family response regulator